MDLSWTCRPPTDDPAHRHRSGHGPNTPVASASAGRESLSDGEVPGEDRHNPLPHLALSTTALK